MPVPASVKYMTDALRRFVDWRERETLEGSVKFGRSPGKTRDVEVRYRWRGPIDLRRPAPAGRPSTSDGRTSFHFKVDAVGRVAAASASGDGRSGNRAIDNDRYLTEGRARELPRSAGMDRYLIGADEKADSVVDPASRVTFVLSNIADSAAEREAFWREVWDTERQSGAARLRLNLTAATRRDWDSLALDPHAPASIQNVAEMMLQGKEPTAGKKYVRKGCRLLEIELEEADLAWARQIGSSYGPTAATRAVHYVEPRAGQVQMRIVMALPAELAPAAHRRIATDFCVAIDAIGMPYLGVIHVPTGRNHAKNHHLHLIAHPASCRRDVGGQFDLAGRRKLRPGEIADCLGRGSIQRRTRGHTERAADDLHALRVLFAAITNAALERAGMERRYDPRSYAEMGIVATPTVSLGTAASALVFAGVDVDIDRDNARKTWAARKLMLADRARERRDEHDGILRELKADGANERDVTTLDLLTSLAARYQEIEQARDALDLLDLQRELAESAAVRLRDNTARLLGEIDAGHAKRADEVERSYIAGRHALAACHLGEIAQATEPYEAEVASVRAEVARIEAEAERIHTEVRLQRRWLKGSVLASSHPARLRKHEHFDRLIDYVHARSDESKTQAVHVWREGQELKTWGLRQLDEQLLADPHFQRRATLALCTEIEAQALSVGRLLRYIGKHGVDTIEASGPADTGAPAAVRKLLRRFRTHPLFEAGVGEAQHRFEQVKADMTTDITTNVTVGKCGPVAVGNDAESGTAVPAVATGRGAPDETAASAKPVSPSPTRSATDHELTSELPAIRTSPVFADFDDDELRTAALARRPALLPGKDDGGPGSIDLPERELAKLAGAAGPEPTRVPSRERDSSASDARPATASAELSRSDTEGLNHQIDHAKAEPNADWQAGRALASTLMSEPPPSQEDELREAIDQTAGASIKQGAAAAPPANAKHSPEDGKQSRPAQVPQPARSSSLRALASVPTGKGVPRSGGLGSAPSLSSTPQPSQSRTVLNLGDLPGKVVRKAPNPALTMEAPFTRDVRVPPPTNSPGQSDAGQHGAGFLRVSTAGLAVGSVAAVESARSPRDHDDPKGQAEIKRVLAALAQLPFLPLRSVQDSEGRTIRHVLVVPRAVPANHEALRIAERHQADRRVQQVFAQKFRRMLDEVRLELTDRREVKPDGRIIELFRNDPHLRSAVNAADGTKEFNEMLDQARKFWQRPGASGATRADRSIATKEASVPEFPGTVQAHNVGSVVDPDIDAEYLLQLNRYRRGPGR